MARTKEQILQEIDKWERRKFNISMVDHWDAECRAIDTECTENINKLQEELKQYDNTGIS